MTLDAFGKDGWELVDFEASQGFVVLQRTPLPAGCIFAAALFIKSIVDGLRKR